MLTETIARHIAEAKYGRLPEEVVTAAKWVILDFLSVSLAGSREPAVVICVDLATEYESASHCSLIGHSQKTSPLMAAYTNGVAGHILDFEPMWFPPTHPASPTIPAILALAEIMPVSGEQLITAVVYGFELQGRLRLTQHAHAVGEGLHLPGIVGVMGSAAASSVILQLSPLQIQMAFGISASRISGLFVNVGSMTKSTHCGNACRAGLEAALLASKGYTAEPNIFEHPMGYKVATGQTHFYEERLIENFGKPFRLIDPGIAIKKYPSQFATQFAIDAALALKRTHSLDLSQIKAIQISAPAMHYIDRSFPASGLEGKFSFQYTTAVALVDGKVGIESFTDSALQRPSVQTLLKKTELFLDPSIPNSFDTMFILLKVTMEDGQVFESRCDVPHGSWRDPLSFEELKAKATYCCGRVLPRHRVQTLIDAIMNIEKASPEEVRKMIALCRPE